MHGESAVRSAKHFPNAEVVRCFALQAVNLSSSRGDNAILVAHHAHGEEAEEHRFQDQAYDADGSVGRTPSAKSSERTTAN
jgi:hypothetical protein